MKNRIDYLDSAKGIGILLVFLGHLVSLSTFPERFIYSFHMPFFFLVAGVFANPSKYSFLEYLCKNAKRTVVPYIIFFNIGLIFTLITPPWNNFTFLDILLSFLDTPRLVNMNPIWFLMCLFFVEVMFFPFCKLVLQKDNPVIAFVFLTGCIIFSPMITSFLNNRDIFVPLKIDVAFSALPFYSIGYLFKQRILDLKNTKNKLFLFIMCFLCTCLASYFNSLIAMVNNTLGEDMLLYIFGAVCGSIMVLLLGYFCRKLHFLQYIGRNSLIFFALHMLIIKIYTFILSRLTGEYKIHQDNLDIIEIIIGFFIVLSVMFVIVYIYNKLKSILLKRINK